LFLYFQGDSSTLDMYMSGSGKPSKLVVPASQIHVTYVFRIETCSSPTSSLPRSLLQEKDYSFLTIVASSNGYKRSEQISLSLSLLYHAHAHWMKRRAPESFLFDAILMPAWLWRQTLIELRLEVMVDA
jgi:hypothetical protein